MAGGVGPIANLQGKVDANNALEVTGSLSIGGTADGDTFTPGTSDVTPVGGYRDDTAPATVTEGDAAAARITEYRALHVNLRDASGNEVAVGGGTQYTEDAAAAANPVGTALNLVRDDARAGGITSADGDNIAARGADDGSLYVKTLADEQQLDYDTGAGTQATTLVGIALPASGGPVAGGTSTNPIHVGDAGGSLTVDGTVTVNAGTNLNTSALALEAGGNLAAAATSLAVLDDWDESDRARVNLIVGQAGVAGGTGLDGATVQRVTLATDVPLPAGTNAIGKLAANSGVDIGDVDILSIAAGDNNIGNVDIVSGTITTVSTLTGGGVAHDSADSGNPHKIGAKAYSPDGTTPGTAVAEGDRTDLKADLDGRLLVSADHPRSLHKHLDGSTAYTDEAIAAAPGAGFQIIITNIIGSTGAATALNFFIEEGATKIFGPVYLEAVAGRGFASGPIRLPVTANTSPTLTSSAAIAQSFDIDYYIQAV